MRRCSWGLAATVLTLTLATAATPPVAANAGSPDRIGLPRGWQPEGITTDGARLYAGSLANGALLRANPRTGKVTVLRDSRTGKPAVGIDYDRWRKVLWVAGGPEGEIRAQNPRTGRVLATFTLPQREQFINDVVATRRAVYATDSVNKVLAVVRLGTSDQVPSSRRARTLELTGDLRYREGFNANGIVRSPRWLVLVQSNTGLLFRVDRRTGRTKQIDLDGRRVRNGDGLEIRGDTLYVVRNRNNLVAVVDLAPNLRRGRIIDRLTADGLDVPTTVALLGDSLWAVNARFGNPRPTTARYWITRIGTGDD
ncbi:MAG TPA: superoxide dismutase [Nocardioidaceae bacterium]|nr:superoxide dismutase [Nocardioidaceae bacterium]